MSLNESMTDDVRERMARYAGPEESRPVTLQFVFEQMLVVLSDFITTLKSYNADGKKVVPIVILAKYESALTELEGVTLPLKKRARNAERLVREILTSVDWYVPADERPQFAEAKREALKPCKTARQILGGQRVDGI